MASASSRIDSAVHAGQQRRRRAGGSRGGAGRCACGSLRRGWRARAGVVDGAATVGPSSSGVPVVHFSQDTPPPEPPTPVAPSILTVGGEFHTVTVASAAVDGKEDTVPPAAPSPIMRRRRFGIELRSLRETAGLTGDQVIERIGWASASKLSRLENGRSRPDPEDVDVLLDLYGADAALREELLGITGEAGDMRGWLQELPGDDPAAARLGRAGGGLRGDLRVQPGAGAGPAADPRVRPAPDRLGPPGGRGAPATRIRRRPGDRGAGPAGPPVAADPRTARAPLHRGAGGGGARPPGRPARGAARATRPPVRAGPAAERDAARCCCGTPRSAIGTFRRPRSRSTGSPIRSIRRRWRSKGGSPTSCRPRRSR